MLGTSITTPSIESSALAAREEISPDHLRGRIGPDVITAKKPGHTKENCWIIQGKPSDVRPFLNTETRGTSSDPNPFRKDQMEAVQKLILQTIQRKKQNLGSLILEHHITT